MQMSFLEIQVTYATIVIDPPWHYSLRPDDDSHRGRITYPSMQFAEIAALPIAELAAPSGCTMFLWTTNNHMGDAFKLLEAWRFTHKSILTWEKIAQNGKTRFGNGHWLRSSTEHCLIATKGKVPAFSSHSEVARRTSNLLKAERREHSRKPDEFYRLVESICAGSKLDMFSRQVREGWTAWGNEINYFEQENIA